MAQIRIKEEKVIYDQHSVLKEFKFDIQKANGEWEEQKREVFDHGNAVTVLLYNKEKKTVVLTRQFRMATHVNGNAGGELLETCAGLLEEGETPETAVIREVEEETGYKISNVQKVCEAFTSPGAFSERVFFYVAPYTDGQKVAAGGGLEEEGEEVKVIEMDFKEALRKIESGGIIDAKTILLLYYLQTKGIM
jgi:nudix-type nucleoside diphosphatase (YffH/AdpP family)